MPSIPKKSKATSAFAKNLKTAKEKEKAIPKIPHVIIRAGAGSGKTTTLIEGLKKLRGVKSDHPAAKNPSPQQRAIWDSLMLSKDAVSVAFIAFNTSIADELKARVPPGCDARTSHSLGNLAITNAYGRLQLNNDRTQIIVCELLGRDIWDVRKRDMVLLKACCDLSELVKQNLAETDPQSLMELCRHFDVELDKYQSEVFALIPKIIERSKDVLKDKCIAFVDMIWLPIALGLPAPQFDLLLVDEAQDLNRCQQALVQKYGKRLLLCGDPKQAIYGFAGADNESMSRMFTILSETPAGCEILPLNYTRRCAKAIVREANIIVPDFYAFESNAEGIVDRLPFKGERPDPTDLDGQGGAGYSYRAYVNDGNMLLCRTNAPLVSECFKFLKAGRKANIQGKDIGQGLIKTINKIEKRSPISPFLVKNLIMALEAWLRDETEKENVKKFPSETRLMALQDRHDCLQCFCDDADPDAPVSVITGKIESIFSDKSRDGILLSSVHKAKGLEAKRVFLLEPESSPIPHPMAKQKWEIDQEYNLRYVAITRAIEHLTYVS